MNFPIVLNNFYLAREDLCHVIRKMNVKHTIFHQEANLF